MDRRTFLAATGAVLFAAPLAADAQQAGKIYRIGFLNPRSGQNEWDEAFRQTLRELGYVEGRTITIEYRWGAGNEERLAEMAAELVQLKVDIIVAAATVAIQAAKRATNTIPIVMAALSASVRIWGVARPPPKRPRPRQTKSGSSWRPCPILSVSGSSPASPVPAAMSPA